MRGDDEERGGRVCVDLNGVLDTYAGWRGEVTWHPPRPGAREFLRRLKRQGYEVVVLTVRDSGECWSWLASHGLDRWVDAVTDRKVPALAYVDDRAIRFRGDFEASLLELLDFAPHWQHAQPGRREPGPAEPSLEDLATLIVQHVTEGARVASELVRQDRRSNQIVEARLDDGRVLVVKYGPDPGALERFRASVVGSRLARAHGGLMTPRHLELPEELRGHAIIAYWRVAGPTLAEVLAGTTDRDREEQFAAFGELAGRLHRVWLPGHGHLPSAIERSDSLVTFIRDDLDGRLGPAIRGEWPEGAPTLEGLVALAPQLGPFVDARPVLLHNDLFDQNVLCASFGPNLPVGLIDFEDCLAGPPEADLAKAELLHGPLFARHIDQAWLDPFYEGYGRRPDGTALAFFRVFHLLNMGYHAAWRGWADHAAALARVAAAELAAVGTGRTHEHVVRSA